jgi:HlyD family secretion protein
MTPPATARAALILGFATLALLLAGFGTWAATARLAGALLLPGRVEVAQDHQIVQHPEGGIVSAVFVAEGEAVAAGQILLRLEGTALVAERAALQAELIDLAARRARLEAERDDAATLHLPAAIPEGIAADQRRLFDLRRMIHRQTLDATDQRLAATTGQIAGTEAQLASLARQRALIAVELSAQKTLLDKGLAHSARVLALDRETARLQGEIARLIAEQTEAAARAAELRLVRQSLAAERRATALDALQDVARAEVDLVARRAALDGRIARLALRAPADGVVLGLRVTTPGAVIRPAEPLLALVAQDRPLVVAVQLPPRLIARVQPDQPARLRLPQDDRAEIAGRIGLVAADALPAEAGHPPSYRIEIWPDAAELARLPRGTMRPGLPVEAVLDTGTRTALDRLTSPLTDYLSRAMRDG